MSGVPWNFIGCTPAHFTPGLDTHTWAYTAGKVQPGTAGVTLFAYAGAVFPPGVTLTNFKLRGTRTSTGDICRADFFKITDAGGSSSVAALTLGVGNGAIETTISEPVGSDSYTIRLQLAGSTAAADAFAIWTEFEYTMPSYADTL